MFFRKLRPKQPAVARGTWAPGHLPSSSPWKQLRSANGSPHTRRLAAILLFPCLGVTANVTLAASVSVLTYHNDRARTGQNTNETVLAPSNVNTNSFGKLFAYAVDGFVYAQPLVLANVTIPSNGVHNVVYVATEHDSVYAFDADSNTGVNATPLWHVSFINPGAGITSVPKGDVNCNDLVPEIGITSTPVIDSASGKIYIEAKTREISGGVTNYVHRLHALDVTTGVETFGGPVLIQASVSGTGDGNDGAGHIPFDGQHEMNRTALLLNNGFVFLGYASHCDNNPYHGWILSYDATNLQQVAAFNATPNGGQGGFWMSGGGPAADAAGDIYFVDGNGSFDANTGGSDYGDTTFELSTTNGLTVVDYFTPFNQANLNNSDLDLGSGGVLLLPDQPGPHPHLAIQAGKEGTIYVLNRDNLGHFQSGSDTQIVQSLIGAIGGSFDTPAYFNSTIYYLGAQDQIRAFSINNGSIASAPTAVGPTTFDFPGATPSISANGTNNGVVWVIQTDSYQTNGPAVLHAYNAANVAQELYKSSRVNADNPGAAVKFAVPTVANGKVYVGTQSALAVFGNFVAVPVISPTGGTFTNSVMVSLTDPTAGAVIYYTLDNTAPTTNSALYAGAFSLTNSATVSAAAFLANVVGSAVVSTTLTIVPTQSPVASFTGTPTSGPAALAVTFTDDSTGSITNRFWTFGNGGTTNTLNTGVVYTYNSTGTNTVTLVVTGPLGASTNTRPNYIIVTNNLAQLAVSPGGRNYSLLPVGQSSTQSFSVANTGVQTLSGTATVSGAPFAVVSGSPFNVNAGQTGLVSISFSPVSAGAFTGSVVFASNDGASTNSVTGSAAVALSAGFTGSPTVGAATLLVGFTDASSGPVTGRVWDFGDGGTSAQTNPSHPYTNAGVFPVSLTVFGPLGSNTLTRASYITVTNEAGPPTAAFVASPTNGAAPLVVTFTDTTMGSTTNHSWMFGDGGTSTATSPMHTYATAGVYSIMLAVSGAGGSSTTSFSNLITVTNLLVIPPSIRLVRPANNMVYPSLTNLTIMVVASANSGSGIRNIEFLVDGSAIGQTTSNPGTNFWQSPTLGAHSLTARASDMHGVKNTSAPVAITVGARNSPIGNWEVTIGGADRGVQYLTFEDDFTASGFGIRLKMFGLDDVSGTWGFNARGQVTGPFLEQANGTTNWNGALLATARSPRSLGGIVTTTPSGAFRWRGLLATTFPDPGGTWTGSVTVTRAAAPVNYVLTADANDSGIFDIAASATPGTRVGQLIVTSRSRTYGYLSFGGRQLTVSGAFNVRRRTMSLQGTSNTGEKVRILLVEQ